MLQSFACPARSFFLQVYNRFVFAIQTTLILVLPSVTLLSLTLAFQKRASFFFVVFKFKDLSTSFSILFGIFLSFFLLVCSSTPSFLPYNISP
jgi:hypothetical protein